MAVVEDNSSVIPTEENPIASHDHEMDEADKGTAVVVTGTLATEEPGQPGVEENTELAKYWKAVIDNPSDFTGWTYLLQFVEQENNIEPAREAFEAFLKRYPYCYGYWKKYADLEKKTGHSDKTWKVFETAVQETPMSIDLWIHYINFAQESYAGNSEKESNVRRLYETALEAAGMEFRSDKLWENYIEMEKQYGNYRNMAAIWDRLIATPTQMYSSHYENYQKFIKEHAPRDILNIDEFLKIRTEVVAEYTARQEAAVASDEAPPGSDIDKVPGDDAPPGEEPKEIAAQDPEEETKAIREKLISMRKEIHSRTEEEVSQRWAYEEGIRRPYFHVKPLEKTQLTNWHSYLDFEMAYKNDSRIKVLFERCLVACALYEEFWIKYAKYIQSLGDLEGVRTIYKRACQVHLPKKANVHLAWAAFEESQGHSEEALKIISDLEKNVPGLAMVALRTIGLKRRNGNREEAEQLYTKYIEEAKNVEEKSFYAIKYARYLSKVSGDTIKAESLLENALKEDPTNHKVLLQLIDLEFRQPTINEEKMLHRFEQAINAKLAIEHRVAFSQRRLEFLEDFSSSVASLMKGYEEHQELVKEMQTVKKRKAEEDGESKSKKAKLDGSVNGSGDHLSMTAAASTNSMGTASSGYSQPPPQNNAHQGYNAQDYSQQQYGNYNQWQGYGNTGYNQGYNQNWNYQQQQYY